MLPGIRHGFASTLDRFATWWRSRAPRTAPVRVPPPHSAPDPRGDTAEHALALIHAGEALRRALSFMLDGEVREPRAESCPTAEADEDSVRVEHARQLALLTAVSDSLARLEVQARYLPRRPSLLPRLMSAINSDAGSMHELATIIGGDPTLLGNLLRVANSAFYRMGDKPVDSLERAVIRVGTEGIRSLVATALLHPVMAGGEGEFAGFPERIWEQTQYAADAAELHAKRVARVDPFGARLLALLQGLAVNTVFRIARDEARRRGDTNIKPAMLQLLEQWTGPMALRIAAAWELPAGLQQALMEPAATNPLARSLEFARLAGSQVLMVRHGQLKAASARAAVLASDECRMQLDRVWDRLAVAWLRPG